MSNFVGESVGEAGSVLNGHHSVGYGGHESGMFDEDIE